VEHGTQFDKAVQAVISGNMRQLQGLLDQHPELVHERSTSPHRATLLHYVAANGVEDELQISPPNAPQIAQLLLGSGAEVDALAQTYGADHLQTTLNLLVSSVHPARAKVQVPLIDVLLDAEAAIEGLADDGSPLLTAIAFAYTPAVDRLVERGARVASLLAAAGVGDLERVESYFTEDGNFRAVLPLPTVPWVGPTSNADEYLARALLYAALHERTDVMLFLLGHGVDIDFKLGGSTCLHQLASHGRLNTVQFLVEQGANTQILDDQFQGTAYGWAQYCGHPAVSEYLERVTERGI
jgi:ankyrin repeat protein